MCALSLRLLLLEDAKILRMCAIKRRDKKVEFFFDNQSCREILIVSILVVIRGDFTGGNY